MANENQTFPTLTASTWWKLRKKFNSSVPKELTPSYLATALEMTEESAKTNVIPKLKLLGFIDENNKPTDLSIKWRDDSEYKNVCDELIKKLYPSELLDAIDDPINNKDRVIKWFKSKARVGENAGNKMASFYLLLYDADILKQNVIIQSKVEKLKKSNTPIVKETRSTPDNSNKNHNDQNDSIGSKGIGQPSIFKPTIHLDIQIHISPDSPAEQIDKIFESMAKHLSGFKV